MQVERVARESERASAGLPVAVQVIARPWRDHVALAAMTRSRRSQKSSATIRHGRRCDGTTCFVRSSVCRKLRFSPAR